MEGEYVLKVDMVVKPGEVRPFVEEELASILASIIPLTIEAYCNGVVGGVVSVKLEPQSGDPIYTLLESLSEAEEEIENGT